jgi:hypothetical protein
MTDTNELKWSFFQIWNASLEKNEERKLSPRDYIYASEIGGAYLDRYYKMKGVEYTNPPNMRSLRKFEAGNIWEWIVQLILKRAGILINSQEHLDFQYPDMLRVAGRLDHLAGGKPDWEKGKKEMEELDLPDIFKIAVNDILDYFNKNYPNGLETLILEVKSVSSFMFETYLKTGQANLHHKLQLFHYLKAKGLHEGHIIYICKDDCRMLEFGVFNPSDVEDIYKSDIAIMTDYIQQDIEPTKEELLTFDEVSLRFSYNWKVGYSPYLTKIYGYKDQMEYQNLFSPVASKWNRVFKRIVNGDKMTKLNLEVIEEIKRGFPKLDEYVELAKLQIKQNPDILDETDETN